MRLVYHAEPFTPEQVKTSGRRLNACPQLTSNMEKSSRVTPSAKRCRIDHYGLKAHRPSRQTIRPLAA